MKLKIPNSDRVFLDSKEIKELIQEWKENEQSIVFTNGCFDILHAGHVDYLEKASEKGNRLIVGLNSDESVSRLKGENRPIITSSLRAKLLVALEVVDAVVMFSEDTPFDLINSIQPDVLIKGSDYEVEKIIGAMVVLENGGKVETIDFVHSISTSQIIDKIKAL